MVQECWAATDNLAAFSQAIEEQGLFIAGGGRRAHVVVSYEGEVFALSRFIDKKSRNVTTQLGAPDNAPTVTQAKAKIANAIAPKLSAYIREARKIAAKAMEPLELQRREMRERRRQEV